MRRRAQMLFAAAFLLSLAWPSVARERRRGRRAPDKLEVGDAAPDFALVELDEEGNAGAKVRLSEATAARPVVLVMSSYT